MHLLTALENYRIVIQQLSEIKKAERVIVYVYGAGRIGMEAIILLEREGIVISAVAVSKPENNMQAVKGYPVKGIAQLQSMKQEALVVIAVAQRYQEEVLHTLNELEFENYLLLELQKQTGFF